MLVPVPVLGRDLRFGPILLVPVHRLDRDALQVDAVQVQRFGADRSDTPCKGLVLAPVHCLDWDALQVGAVLVNAVQVDMMRVDVM